MRAQYASYLRDLDAVDHLLANLFRLMPDNPVIQLKDSLTSHSPNQKLSNVMSMFNRDPQLQVSGAYKVRHTMSDFGRHLSYLLDYVTRRSEKSRFV